MTLGRVEYKGGDHSRTWYDEGMNEELADKLVFYGRRWLNRIVLALAILLMLPTTAIMATWNTLPGQKLYPVKLYLEQLALKLVGDNFAVKADLQAQFVEQRFNETEVLLTQSSGEGLSGLTREIGVAKSEIVAARKREGTKDSEVAQVKAEKMVTQLKEYNQKLESTKVQLAAPASAVAQATGAPAPSAALPSVPESPPEGLVQVEEAQEEIEEVISELEEVSRGKSDDKNKGDNKEKNKEKKDDK